MTEKYLFSLKNTRKQRDNELKSEIYKVLYISYKLAQITIEQDKIYQPPKPRTYAIACIDNILDEGASNNWQLERNDLLIKITILLMNADINERMPTYCEAQSASK